MRRLGDGPPDIVSTLFLMSHRITPLLSGKQIRWKADYRFNLSVGRVIVAVLCSFESRGQQLIEFVQHDDGCTLLAKMPFKFLVSTGELAADIRKKGNDSVVVPGVRIPGARAHRSRSVRKSIEALYSDILHISSLDEHL